MERDENVGKIGHESNLCSALVSEAALSCYD